MTLKEFKGRLVVGTLVRHVLSMKGPVNEVYEVSRVQGNGVYFRRPEKPSERELWFEFPKRADLTFGPNGFSRLYPNGESKYEWFTLAELVTELVNAEERDDLPAVFAKFELYLRLRQTHPEPRVKLHGQEWGGDHVASRHNDAALLKRDGPAYKNYN